MGKQGIYAIRCSDGRSYVGGSHNPSRRWQWHRSRLNRGRHANAKLQVAWASLGSEAFEFVTLERVFDAERMTEREQYWIDKLRGATEGFNLSPTAGGSNRGIVRSLEVRARVSVAHVGVQAGTLNPQAKLTEDHVRDIRRALDRGETQRDLADQYGICRQTVSKIKLRTKWSSLE